MKIFRKLVWFSLLTFLMVSFILRLGIVSGPTEIESQDRDHPYLYSSHHHKSVCIVQRLVTISDLHRFRSPHYSFSRSLSSFPGIFFHQLFLSLVGHLPTMGCQNVRINASFVHFSLLIIYRR